jgi:hypothetical protein
MSMNWFNNCKLYILINYVRNVTVLNLYLNFIKEDVVRNVLRKELEVITKRTEIKYVLRVKTQNLKKENGSSMHIKC